MSPESFGGDKENIQFNRLIGEAKRKFQPSDLFTYIGPGNNELITMNLETAIRICGSRMLSRGEDFFWSKLFEMQELALKVSSSSPTRFAQSIERGLEY